MFLPPSISIINTTDGLSVSPEKGDFGTLFEALYFQKFSTEYFYQFCPLFKRETEMEKQHLEKNLLEVLQVSFHN